MENAFFDIGSESQSKWGERVCGDTLITKKIREEGRVVAILSDGLGSGIKASVLSTLTATMALKYLENHLDIVKAASVIMKTLPVCKVRKISYATFTIIDISSEKLVKIVEYDTPSLLHFSENNFLPIERRIVKINHGRRPTLLHLSEIELQKGDRIIFHSDGLNQAGLGKRGTPSGWGQDGIKEFIKALVSEFPSMSGRAMAKQLVNQANNIDGWKCGDDTTCGVIYLKDPQSLLIATGPPLLQASDTVLAQQFREYNGTKVICGDTTAKILARELQKELTVNIRNIQPGVPPVSSMSGVDLVTEGIITMSKVFEYLNAPQLPAFSHDNPALSLANRLLEHDEITFLVGTKMNDANFLTNNTSVETRHTIVRKLAVLLEERYLKKTVIKIL